MSENQNRGIHDFTKYDSMTTEELEEILRLDSEAQSEQESDTEKILYIMEVLADREKTNGTGKIAQKAWESFQQEYLPDEEACSAYTPEEGTTSPRRPWLRRVAAVAAAMVLIVCLSATASAFGWQSIWKAVATWAKETFSFVSEDQTEESEPSPDNIKEYASLQEALLATNVTPDFIPTWIPEGYVLDRIVVDENPMQRVYIAYYEHGEKAIKITVRSYLEEDLELVEINDTLLEIYESSGREYHIFENVGQLRALWSKDTYECYISGELTIEEIKMMIDSIGKG